LEASLSQNRSVHGKTILGLRAEPSGFHWAIVTGTLKEPVMEGSGSESVPESFTEAESLAWIRQKADHIIDIYKPEAVAVRYPERVARGFNKDSAKSRCRVEGVLVEVSGTKNRNVVTGSLNTFGKHLGSKSPKDDLSSDELRGLDWSQHKDKIREAILVAVSLLPSE
jgi:hypothetical protein